MNYQYLQSFPNVNVEAFNIGLEHWRGQMVDQAESLEKNQAPDHQGLVR